MNMLKHLSISRRNKYIIVYYIALFCLFFANNVGCNAQELVGEKVQIHSSYSNIYLPNTIITVGIDFSQYSAYNDNMYLSYHIYDKNSEECLLYDNERKLIVKSDNRNVVEMEMNIKIPKELSSKELYIVYDVLDLNAGCWLSQQDRTIVSDETYYNKSVAKGMLQQLQREIFSNLVIFCVNVVVFVGCIIAIYIIKKKQIL